MISMIREDQTRPQLFLPSLTPQVSVLGINSVLNRDLRVWVSNECTHSLTPTFRPGHIDIKSLIARHALNNSCAQTPVSAVEDNGSCFFSISILFTQVYALSGTFSYAHVGF